MTTISLRYADRPAAIAALATLGLTTTDRDGNATIPNTAFAEDGSRIDLLVDSGGSGIRTRPTGQMQPGPAFPGSGTTGPSVPVYEVEAGFFLTVCGDRLPAFGDAETGDSVIAIVAPDAPPAVPDGPTLSDWRVGLLRWGRLQEVSDKIAALVASGNPAGMEARERFEYANNVYRKTLMLLKDAIGFTEADVDESLRRAVLATG